MSRELLVINRLSSSGGAFLRALAEKGVDLTSFWEDRDLAISLGVKKSLWERGRALLDSSWPEEEQERCVSYGGRIIFQGDGDYPTGLMDLDDPPPVIYLRGRLQVSRPSVSVVGTRRCSTYGVAVANSLGLKLAQGKISVISGGASGVDGAAHSGALDGGGYTLAVLGTGVDLVYPRGHDRLFSSILRSGGGLISRFPMGESGQRWNFPKRNGMIAALATHVVVVESPMTGGSMITARLAGEIGREIWAVLGPIDRDISKGSNRLIFDGAQPLWDLDHFMGLLVGEGQLPLFGDRDESPVLKGIRISGKVTLDELSNRVGLSVPEVMASLVSLEMDGKVYRSGPGRWSVVP
ncbi:MAG: DNA-protecting protein DprA [Synergistales bacterium]|nr:DNA-protecting protein DprA [Synergistales bacterium]